MPLPTDAEHWYLDDNAANNTVAAFIGTAGTMLTSAGAALNTNLVSVVAPGNLVNGFGFKEYNTDANYVSIPYNAAYNVNDNLSISLWVKLDAGNAVCNVFGRWAGVQLWEMQLRHDNLNNNFVASIKSGTTIYYVGAAAGFSFTDNVLYHLVFTFASGVVKLYVNGVLNNQATIAGTTINTSGTEPIRLGNCGDGNNTYGWIYEARVYTGTVLTLAQVQQLYNSGNGTQAELANPSYQPRGTGLGTPFIY